MNTKDNQEAELLRLDDLLKIKEACEKALAPIGNMSDAPVLNALKKGMEFNSAMWPQQILNLVNEVLELRATPQVNEEVASGEAVAWEYDEYVDYQDCKAYWTKTILRHKLEDTELGKSKEAIENRQNISEPRYINGRALTYIHPPTPSPSNVLVEALRKLARLGNEPQLGTSEGNMIARNALEAYGVKL